MSIRPRQRIQVQRHSGLSSSVNHSLVNHSVLQGDVARPARNRLIISKLVPKPLKKVNSLSYMNSKPKKVSSEDFKRQTPDPFTGMRLSMKVPENATHKHTKSYSGAVVNSEAPHLYTRSTPKLRIIPSLTLHTLSVVKDTSIQQFGAHRAAFEQFIENERSNNRDVLVAIKTGYEEFIHLLTQELSSRCPQNDSELKELRKREKQYLKALKELKMRGYPVEEVCGDIQKDSAESEKTASSESKRDKEVPKLQVPLPDPARGFQEEFMLNYDEFSESWRNLINNSG